VRAAGRILAALALLAGGTAPTAAVETKQEALELSGSADSSFGAGLDVHGDVAVVAAPAALAIHVFVRSPVTDTWAAGPVIAVSSPAAFPSMSSVVATDGQWVFYGVSKTVHPDFPEAELRATSLASPTTHVVVGTYSSTPLALAAAGGVLAAGFGGHWLAPGAGTVQIFELVSGTWTLQDTFSDGADAHALGAAVATDGKRVVAGSPTYGNNGAVRVYARNLFGWFEQQLFSYNPLFQSGAGFGRAVALEGECLYVGAPDFDVGFNPSIGDAGTVVALGWVPSLPGFASRAALRPGTSHQGARFGASLATDGNTVIVGAPDKPGVFNKIQGAAYVFHRTGNDCQPGVRWREAFLLRSYDQLAPPNPPGELGRRVGLSAGWGLAADPRAPDDSSDGRVYAYRGVTVLFWDGFESGDPSRWSQTAP
jgi:hypothetical protein